MWIVSKREGLEAFSYLLSVVLFVSLLSFSAQAKPGQWIVIKRFITYSPKADIAEQRQESKSGSAPILEDIFFTDHLNGWIVGNGSSVALTSNGGFTWRFSTVDAGANLRGVFFINRLTGWAVGDHERQGIVFVTRDGGRQWLVLNRLQGFELSGLHKIWFADKQHGWAVGEAQLDGIVRGIVIGTDDGGRVWRTQYLSDQRCSALTAIKFVGPRSGWAVGDGLILHTTDGGLNWGEQFRGEMRYLFGLDMVTAKDGYAVGSNGLLLHTNNGGETWVSQALPAAANTVWLSSVRFITPLRGWVAGNEGAIFSTINGGRTWKIENLRKSEYLRGLALTSRNAYAVGNNGVLLRRRI